MNKPLVAAPASEQSREAPHQRDSAGQFLFLVCRLRIGGIIYALKLQDDRHQRPHVVGAELNSKIEQLQSVFRAVALFKLRPDHTADEQVEAVVELTQSALDSLGLKPGMIKPL